MLSIPKPEPTKEELDEADRKLDELRRKHGTDSDDR
jgi:hypothetical protein